MRHGVIPTLTESLGSWSMAPSLKDWLSTIYAEILLVFGLLIWRPSANAKTLTVVIALSSPDDGTLTVLEATRTPLPIPLSLNAAPVGVANVEASSAVRRNHHVRSQFLGSHSP